MMGREEDWAIEEYWSAPFHDKRQHVYTTGLPLRSYSPEHPIPKSLTPYLAPNPFIEQWRYESRREAQQILPWVWLGSFGCTKDKGLLAERGITLLIAVRNSMTAQAGLMAGGLSDTLDTIEAKLKHPLGRAGAPAHITLDLPRTKADSLIPTFHAAAHLIDRNYYLSMLSPLHVQHLDNVSDPDYHSLVLQYQQQFPQPKQQHFDAEGKAKTLPYPIDLPRPGSTLVFCETGNEDSAGIVASYIMQHFEVHISHAVGLIRGWRTSVSLDDSHQRNLEAWDSVYKSTRDVRRAKKEAQEQGSTVASRVKRSFEESHAKGGPCGRSGLAPFTDESDDDDDGLSRSDGEEMEFS